MTDKERDKLKTTIKLHSTTPVDHLRKTAGVANVWHTLLGLFVVVATGVLALSVIVIMWKLAFRVL